MCLELFFEIESLNNYPWKKLLMEKHNISMNPTELDFDELVFILWKTRTKWVWQIACLAYHRFSKYPHALVPHMTSFFLALIPYLCMTIAVKKHTKLGNKFLKSSSNLLHFFTLCQVFCKGLQVIWHRLYLTFSFSLFKFYQTVCS